MSGEFYRLIAWGLGAALMICGLNDLRAQESRDGGGSVSSNKPAASAQKLDATESSELAAAAARSFRELEAMGYFAAEDFSYRKNRKLSVLETYNRQINGNDPSAPLTFSSEMGSNYRVNRSFWKQIAQTNQAFANAWNLLDESGGVNGRGGIELRCKGTLPFRRITPMDGSGNSYPMLYQIEFIKQTLEGRGPGATLTPDEAARLRELKQIAEKHLAEYRAMEDAYRTIIAGLEAAQGRTQRRNMLKTLDDSMKDDVAQGVKNADDPPEKLVLRALEAGSKDKTQCQQLLKLAGLKNYPPALFNLYVGNCFGYFRTGIVTDGDPAAAAHYRQLWLESDGTSAALQAIGEGYLAGVIVARREYLVALSANDEMGLDRTVSNPAGMAFSPGERERGVLAAYYDRGTLTMSGSAVTERLTLSNYRVIFEGPGWLPRSSVPGNQQELKYRVNIENACRYFEKAAWKAVENLKAPGHERQREIRVLKRSLEVIGQSVVDRKWQPVGDSRLSALAKETATLTQSLPAGTIPDVFLTATGRMMKDADDEKYLESLGIKK